MWKQVSASCVVLAIGALWGACAGETFLDAQQKLPCDTADECPHGQYADGTTCINGYCECPNPDEELCCKPGAGFNDCERECRPAAECHVELCKSAEDCTDPVDSRCGEAVCMQGICSLEIVEKLPSQLVGDCKVITCDRVGRAVAVEAARDVFNDFNECTLDTCVKGEIANIPHGAGKSPESTAYCDGTGRRIECITDDNCGDSTIFCSPLGECVPSWCINGVKDTFSGETAIDCGGRCDPCPVGRACEANSDCIEQNCGDDKKCKASDCDDRIKNGSETDIDCGSPSCRPCSPGRECHAHDDCDSGVCVMGRCQANTCRDGVWNGFETDMDCGGGQCPDCPLYINLSFDE